MKFSRKQLLVISTVIILIATSSITFAYIFYSHEVNLSGGVSTEGAIVLYKADGTYNHLFEFDFPYFHPTPFMQDFKLEFIVENVGNSACDAIWEIGEDSELWNLVYYAADDTWYFADGPSYEESQYVFYIDYVVEGEYIYWTPAPHGHISLEAGQQANYRFLLRYTGYDNTATDLTLHIHFAATDEIV